MTSHNAFAARTCIVGVVITNESNMAWYFPEAGNLNGSNAGMCSDVMCLGRQVAARAIFLTFDLALDPLLLLFHPLLALLVAILDLSLTTTPKLPFEACYVIMHKVYSCSPRMLVAK